MSAKQRSKQTNASAAGMQMWHVAIAVVVAAAAVPAYLYYYAVPAEVQPLRAKKLTDLAQFTKEYKDSMLWGSYRSGLYFGMRTRAPKSLLAGLVWFDPDAVETLMQQRVRYKANQDDGLQQYGWVRHDGRTWGQQIIIDGSYNITLTMVKHQAPGGGPGGDWALRAHVTRGKGHEPNGIRRKRISLLLYLTDEDKPKNSWAVLPQGEPDTLREPVQLVRGGNTVVGDFSLHVVESGPSRKVPGRLNYLGMMSVEGERDFRHEVNNLMLSIIYENMQRNPMSDVFHMELPNGAMTDSDLAMFQVTIPVGGTTDWVFLSHGRGPLDDDAIDERVAALSGDALTQIINERDAEFEQRFAKTFPVASSPVQDGPSETQVQEVAKAALSNLLGSMGYFYGRSKIRLPGRSEPVLYWPAALFTAVPSRSFFPRGFLWDEGFHQLLINRWDPLLSREVLSYWLDLMNSQGWIPREQILGVEAEQRVPAEFVVQNPHHANPPSLFLPISNMAQMLHADGGPKSGSHTELREFLLAAWPRLEAWYQWYNTTQLGQLPGSYRWRGREEAPSSELNPKTLTSGLDDYPRSSHPSQDERHLDLRCWMALASQAMASIATSLGLDQQVADKYTQTAERLADMSSLDAQHWDEARQQFLDWGMHTEAVRLKKTRVGPPGQTQDMMVRVVDQPPTPRYVPHFGYVSLFPLLMRLLPADSPRLGVLLNQLRDSALLWTPYGLRSLSAESTLYKQYNTEHDPPYWRGQIWININYLTLASLRHYGSMPGPNQEAAAQLEVDLQAAITKGLVSQYFQQGYLYEQYDDSTGHGKSSHPFTGWTALITLIATGTY